jgi:uncharacterized protein
MDHQVEQRIQASLDDIISHHNVRILLAIESGSRAWGFASEDSDYDVRFIYCHPLDDYVRISPMRDVIELPIVDDLDINGWDLKKAMGLLLKSNPPMLEWLSSPIIYRQDPLIELLRNASKDFFDPVSTSYHYLSMAVKNHKYLQADLVARKKYLYVLRPLFCIEWIAANHSMPPMQFDKLVEYSLAKGKNPGVAEAIEQLLVHKKQGKEVDKQPREPVLDVFIEQRLHAYQSKEFGKSKQQNVALADEIFRDILHGLAK